MVLLAARNDPAACYCYVHISPAPVRILSVADSGAF
jgi:hypothetical protein